MPYRVFLSHASGDSDLAADLKAEIERFDVEVYMYQHDAQPGSHLPSKILGKVQGADALVVFLTAAAENSPAVNQEIGAALASNKHVIPLLEEGVSPNQFSLLQGKEWMEFSRGDRERTQRAVADWVEGLRRKKAKMTTILGLVVAGLFLWANSRE